MEEGEGEEEWDEGVGMGLGRGIDDNSSVFVADERGVEQIGREDEPGGVIGVGFERGV